MFFLTLHSDGERLRSPRTRTLSSFRIHTQVCDLLSTMGKSFANFKVFDYLSWAWSSGMLLFLPCVFCISQRFTLWDVYDSCAVLELFFYEPFLSSLSLWRMLASFWWTLQGFLNQPNSQPIKRSLLLINWAFLSPNVRGLWGKTLQYWVEGIEK